MKVICINTKDHAEPRIPKLTEGEVYEVLDCQVVQDTHAYKIKGYEGDAANRWWYAQADFIPCSDIDETEFIRETNTQYA